MNATITKNELRRKILLKVLIRFFLVFIFIGILLFVPAGSLKYFNGWLFIAGLLIPMTFALIYLYINDPELLEKRINLKEKEDAQKKYIKLSIIFYIVVYIIPGLDYRFNWSNVPMWLVLVSLTVMIFGYVMFIIVMLQNRYASRVIEIQNEQKLIDNGLYSIVRHPMYLSATILYLSSSIVLGSYFALIPMLLLPFLLAFRIKNEEKVLSEGLPGYEEYMKKVRYRMIPFIW
ncbi:MAG TPA: isoprenylcysteine carboxylmethyltransferase family protein [Bacteroidales bacterium]|nr:isoprenylcysteine carboxylmethyltransferase family protein [Bacteroidales bacterium]